MEHRSGLIAQESGVYGTHFLLALETGGNARGNEQTIAKQSKANQTKPHQTHRCHRRGRYRWREVVTQGLAVCILGIESQRRTLSLEGGLLENIDFQTKYYDAQITVRCGGCKAPVDPKFTLVRKMRSPRTKMHICQMNYSVQSPLYPAPGPVLSVTGFQDVNKK